MLQGCWSLLATLETSTYVVVVVVVFVVVVVVVVVFVVVVLVVGAVVGSRLLNFAGNSPNFNLCGGCSCGGCHGSWSGCWCSCRYSKSWTLTLDWPKPISKGAVISRVKIDSRLKEKFTMMLNRIFHDFSANNSKSTEIIFSPVVLTIAVAIELFYFLKNSRIGYNLKAIKRAMFLWNYIGIGTYTWSGTEKFGFWSFTFVPWPPETILTTLLWDKDFQVNICDVF